MEERVLVVDRAALEERLKGQMFVTEGIDEIRDYIVRNHFFLPRSKAEYDTAAKQIIPYVVIRRGEKYFLLQRLKKQTEARLHDRLSLGVGGHINPSEEAAGDPLYAGLLRELREEVAVEDGFTLSVAGILNENNGGVSDFHTGLVCLLETEGEVTVRETEKMSGSWAGLEELRAVYDRLETWSQIALDCFLDPIPEKPEGLP